MELLVQGTATLELVPNNNQIQRKREREREKGLSKEAITVQFIYNNLMVSKKSKFYD